MGRHNKRGLDYFHVDCNQEDNLTLIEAKHGISGYGTVVKIWKKIYQINGYYCEWDEKNQLLFAREIGVEIGFLKEVVISCFEEGIFHRGLCNKFKILTSSGTQKRWKAIVTAAKRKDTEIDEKHLVSSFIQEEIAKTTEEITKTHEESTQSKVKENKVEESKVKESKLSSSVPSQATIIQMGSFKVISEKEFYDSIANFKTDYPKEFLREFYEYWKERGPTGKMRFQYEKTWELNLRLKKWKRTNKNSNDGNYKGNYSQKPIAHVVAPGNRGRL